MSVEKSSAITIFDVAERAGVSYSTVSRVVNNFVYVKPATRKKVQAAMEELGYVANLKAREVVLRGEDVLFQFAVSNMGFAGETVSASLFSLAEDGETEEELDLRGADVVFYNGLLLEGKMTDVLVRVASSGKSVKAVTEAILNDSDYLLELDDGSEHTDPHVWMDVRGWIQAVPVVAETLAAFDPQHAETYAANAVVYMHQLEALDAYAQKSIASIPEGQRVLVTAHDAFNYLGRATGLTVRGIQGVSTESEAGVRDLEDLVDYIVEQQIPAVFVETSVADKNVRALVEGATARGHAVIIGGALFSDAMGQAGTYEGTYIGMIDHNITTITSALRGEAPAAGMQRKLTGVAH